jgi:hypothetical protein
MKKFLDKKESFGAHDVSSTDVSGRVQINSGIG